MAADGGEHGGGVLLGHSDPFPPAVLPDAGEETRSRLQERKIPFWKMFSPNIPKRKSTLSQISVNAVVADSTWKQTGISALERCEGIEPEPVCIYFSLCSNHASLS